MLDFKVVAAMKVSELLQNDDFRSHFVWLYCTAHNQTEGQGQAFFDREMTFLAKMFDDDVKLRQATTLSVFLALLDLAYHALSIEPVAKAQAYIYLSPKNLAGKDEPARWEQRAVYKISGYGELTLRVRSGVIKYADNPVLVYEGDYFEPIDGIVHHTPKKLSKRITDAYIKITRGDGSVDYKWFSMDEIYSFKNKSKTQGSVAWTGGVDGQPTRGMIDAKVIKHAFSTYPRLVIGGQNTQLETDTLDGDAAYASLMAKMAGAPEETTAPVAKEKATPPPAPPVAEKKPEPPAPAAEPETDPYWDVPMTDFNYQTEEVAPTKPASVSDVPDFDI